MRLSARPLTILRSLVIGAVTAGVASLVLPGATALAVGGVVVLGLLVPWARVVATVGAVGFIVAGALNVIRGQEVHRYAPGSDWAGAFVHAGNLVWIGMALLLADGVITAFGLRTKRLPGRRAWRAGAGGQAGRGRCADGAGGSDGGDGPDGGGGPEDAGGPAPAGALRRTQSMQLMRRTRSRVDAPAEDTGGRCGPLRGGRGACPRADHPDPEPVTQPLSAPQRSGGAEDPPPTLRTLSPRASASLPPPTPRVPVSPWRPR